MRVMAIGHAGAGSLVERISAVTDGRGESEPPDGEDDYLEAVGLRVRVFRMARGLSQDQLARRASVSRVTLGSIERADHAASLMTYRKLARALGRDVGELVADGEVLPPRR
jgi:DNA-binding XRE family transcriptional regulator